MGGEVSSRIKLNKKDFYYNNSYKLTLFNDLMKFDLEFFRKGETLEGKAVVFMTLFQDPNPEPYYPYIFLWDRFFVKDDQIDECYRKAIEMPIKANERFLTVASHTHNMEYLSSLSKDMLTFVPRNKRKKSIPVSTDEIKKLLKQGVDYYCREYMSEHFSGYDESVSFRQLLQDKVDLLVRSKGNRKLQNKVIFELRFLLGNDFSREIENIRGLSECSDNGFIRRYVESIDGAKKEDMQTFYKSGITIENDLLTLTSQGIPEEVFPTQQKVYDVFKTKIELHGHCALKPWAIASHLDPLERNPSDIINCLPNMARQGFLQRVKGGYYVLGQENE